ncbi:hypothetical protein LPUS_03318 [Lasallia pustulata]|uniref:Uncharacterized protein n=1 Tax=Lasallia pustulata TaxID=136370 RepID=A0A1W5CUK9_9LECA|nr:hypothetical protein LPUS_03318 [Lasallia pustulata]
MKSTIIAALAVAAFGASAQDVTTTTEYYDDCTMSSMGAGGTGAGGMVTVTGTITDTYCGECTMGKSGTTTVYTTVYDELCPNGTQSATYTITEAYSAGQVLGPTHVPSGFVVTTVTCPVCPGSPMVTLTTPVATSAPVTSTAAPMGAGVPAAASSSAIAPAAPVSSSPAQRIPGVPGAASPSGAVGSSNGTLPSPAMFTGAASSMSVGMTLCAGIAGLIGVAALAL